MEAQNSHVRDNFPCIADCNCPLESIRWTVILGFVYIYLSDDMYLYDTPNIYLICFIFKYFQLNQMFCTSIFQIRSKSLSYCIICLSWPCQDNGMFRCLYDNAVGYILGYMQNSYRPDHRVIVAHCIPQPLVFGGKLSCSKPWLTPAIAYQKQWLVLLMEIQFDKPEKSVVSWCQSFIHNFKEIQY